jgi:hypothetical protein
VLDELEEVAARLGVEVRAEPFAKGLMEGRGGLCRIDGRPVVVMDEKLSAPDRVGVLAAALASLDTRGVDVPDLARTALDAARRRKREERRKRARPKRHLGLVRAKPR